ncbi:GFA family protein [Falsihalocynthiibacter sp. S25ZX9]|uniref:GFA family protein n=1 Tax=Falsihalocynthiibacter sp. S25ZX9 TaxID=3240870 RepID=UPI0035103FC3
MHNGSCLCGAVSFTVDGDLAAPNACHCTKCRKHTGHFLVSTGVQKTDLTVTGAENVTWYSSSVKVNRGFCQHCGSTLFFDPPHLDWIAISMGAFDGPTHTKMDLHIFVADKGDYYEITDGLPQNLQ